MNSSTSFSNLISTLEMEFHCSICLCLLTTPITLPCHHFYCKSCIDELFNNNSKNGKNSAYCPECRNVFTRRQKYEDELLLDLVKKVVTLTSSETQLSQLIENCIPEKYKFKPQRPMPLPISNNTSINKIESKEKVELYNTPINNKKETVKSSSNLSTSNNNSAKLKRKPTESLNKNISDLCMICFDEDIFEENDEDLIKCSECTLLTHPSCYGLGESVSIKWVCQECIARRKNPDIRCVACPDNIPGMKPTTNGGWIHISCAQWLPEPCFVNPERRQPIKVEGDNEIAPRRFKIKCKYCKTTNGACFQCTYGRCIYPFHVTCGFKNGIKFEMVDVGDSLRAVVLCPDHSHKFEEITSSIVASSSNISTPSKRNESPTTLSNSTKKKLIQDKHQTKTRISDYFDIVYPGTNSWIVLCGTALEKDQNKLLVEFAQRFGGKVVDEFTDEVTHVITKAFVNESKLWTVPGRPIKYFCGLLRGKWILSFEWISKSILEDEKMEELDYEIQKDNGDGLYSCSRARLDITNGNDYLFQGYEFEMIGFDDRNTLRRGIETMIAYGNGKLVNNASFTNQAKFLYITYEPKHLEHASIPYTALFDCVSQYNITSLTQYLR